jgi:hypothetical protein
MLETPPENAATPGTNPTGPGISAHTDSSSTGALHNGDSRVHVQSQATTNTTSAVGFVSPWASFDELHTWLYASFGIILILLVSWLVTLDGFVTTDKYVLVLVLFISAPVIGWILPFMHARDRSGQSLVLSEAILLLNLAFIFVGSIWLGASSHEWIQAPFNAQLLACMYIAAAAATTVAFRYVPGAMLSAVASWIRVASRAFIFVAPITMLAATLTASPWGFTAPFDVVAGCWGAVLAIALVVVWRAPIPAAPLRPWGKGLLIAAGAIACLMPFAMMDADVSYDTLHYTAYLAPATAVLNGRIPLVDVFCQYGLSYLAYAFAFIFLPRTYHVAALVTTLFNACFTLCFILILRKLVTHRIAFIALAITLPFWFWLFYQWNINRVPSHGGLRYLPLCLVALSLVYLPHRAAFSPWSIAAVAFAWLWSFESFVYSTLLYSAYLTVRASVGVASPRVAMRGIASSLLKLFGLLVALALVVVVAYELILGTPPRFDLYLSMVLAYVGPNPFMDYTYLEPGFYAWVPILAAYFAGACLVGRHLFRATGNDTTFVQRLTVVVIIGLAFGAYCIISTQAFILKVALLPFAILSYWAVERAIRCRTHGYLLSISEVGILPMFVLLAFLLAGVSVSNFGGPIIYGYANTAALRHLVSEGRPWPANIEDRLDRPCGTDDIVDSQAVCSPVANNMGPTDLDEFGAMIARWQVNDPALLTLHPGDAVVSAFFQKPQMLPFSMSYVDGFSPELFADIESRSRKLIETGLSDGQTIIITRDLAALNELEWAVLTDLSQHWALEQVDQTEHLAVYRLIHDPAQAVGPLLTLPNRPVRARNSF